MGSRGLISLRFTWVLTFLLCVSPPLVRTQIHGCSIQGIDLEQCLNQGNINSIDACCKALNQAVQAGFYCLCSLLASSGPPLSTPLVLPLSKYCYISIPPLTLCRVLYPAPIVLPPDNSTETTQPSAPKEVLPMPTPPKGVPPVLLNSTQDTNSTIVARQPHLGENAAPNLSLFNWGNKTSFGGDKTKNLSHWSLLLSIALCAFVL